jgi:hypothetical protein
MPSFKRVPSVPKMGATDSRVRPRRFSPLPVRRAEVTAVRRMFGHFAALP